MIIMDHIEQRMLKMRELQPKVPSWAKAEHMETSVPQIDLWKYGARYEKPRIISRLFCKAFRALRNKR